MRGGRGWAITIAGSLLVVSALPALATHAGAIDQAQRIAESVYSCVRGDDSSWAFRLGHPTPRGVLKGGTSLQLTIRVPWLTRMRRLAIALGAMLVLIVIALPASAAPPQGIEGEVTVINGLDDPVPVTGEVTADVTGSVDVSGPVTVDNDETDPVPVTGSVAADVTGSVAVSGTVGATQSGDWTVGLDSASQGHLSDIDAATSGLSYDGSSNLNVNLAAGSVATAATPSITASGGTGLLVLHGTASVISAPPANLTALSVHSNRPLDVVISLTPFGTYAIHVPGGTTVTQSFPSPLAADEVTFICRSEDHCNVVDGFAGYD